jgi:hypothetical protein
MVIMMMGRSRAVLVFVAIFALMAEVAILLLPGQWVVLWLAGASSTVLGALAILGVFLAVLIKACISICALVAGAGGRFRVRVIQAGSLLPVAALNLALAYGLIGIVTDEKPGGTLATSLLALAALAVLVAVVCLVTGIARLIPRFNRTVTE